MAGNAILFNVFIGIMGATGSGTPLAPAPWLKPTYTVI